MFPAWSFIGQILIWLWSHHQSLFTVRLDRNEWCALFISIQTYGNKSLLLKDALYVFERTHSDATSFLPAAANAQAMMYDTRVSLAEHLCCCSGWQNKWVTEQVLLWFAEGNFCPLEWMFFIEMCSKAFAMHIDKCKDNLCSMFSLNFFPHSWNKPITSPLSNNKFRPHVDMVHLVFQFWLGGIWCFSSISVYSFK